ncbi:MAG: hypothetical protein B7Y44_11300 [Sphingomonadales bacterium 28-55-16]|nr:MAG: hypothetical protein B7Y44_11300 [Sphingomonadales bacterium 28-55-16]
MAVLETGSGAGAGKACDSCLQCLDAAMSGRGFESCRAYQSNQFKLIKNLGSLAQLVGLYGDLDREPDRGGAA